MLDNEQRILAVSANYQIWRNCLFLDNCLASRSTNMSDPSWHNTYLMCNAELHSCVSQQPRRVRGDVDNIVTTITRCRCRLNLRTPKTKMMTNRTMSNRRRFRAADAPFRGELTWFRSYAPNATMRATRAVRDWQGTLSRLWRETTTVGYAPSAATNPLHQNPVPRSTRMKMTNQLAR